MEEADFCMVDLIVDNHKKYQNMLSIFAAVAGCDEQASSIPH